MALLGDIVASYETALGKGIPLGNLTSQLFSNIYLDVLDQFIKRELRLKNYIRYADDFVVLSNDKESLEKLIPIIGPFLRDNLALTLHPDKVSVRKLHQGVDFLGYIFFPHHSVIRTKTRRRIIRRIVLKNLSSYLGICNHVRAGGVARLLKEKADEIV